VSNHDPYSDQQLPVQNDEPRSNDFADRPKMRPLIGARTKRLTASEGSTVRVSTQAGQSEYTTGIDVRAKLGGRKLTATATSNPMAAKISRNLKGIERFNPPGLPIADSVHEGCFGSRRVTQFWPLRPPIPMFGNVPLAL